MAEKFNIRLLDQTLFDDAKRISSFSLTIRVISFAIGVGVLLFSISFQQLPFVIAIISIFAELLQWRSDHVKKIAESLLRKLEYQDGLGWKISKIEISDLLARSPIYIRKSITNRNPTYQYYENTEELGIKRLLENLVESAWWSKHLSETAGHFFTLITSLIILGSVIVLIISIDSIQNFSVLANISRIITSTLLLLFSLRLIRQSSDFYSFSRLAATSENKAAELLQSGNYDKDRSIKVLIDYQFGRGGAPIIPTWIWKIRRSVLNELWAAHKQQD